MEHSIYAEEIVFEEPVAMNILADKPHQQDHGGEDWSGTLLCDGMVGDGAGQPLQPPLQLHCWCQPS
tara:strand:+ start:1532 stop:1732 length:201 start_codon:yes stop_codon:yes gene_type:complete